VEVYGKRASPVRYSGRLSFKKIPLHLFIISENIETSVLVAGDKKKTKS
jgi:hypothetical protein